MDSKQLNRILSNGIAQGREDSRWKDERIAELTRQRDSYRHSANDLATRCARDEERIAELERKKWELVELLEEYLLVKNRWEQEAHDRKVEAALAKIDAQENDDG